MNAEGTVIMVFFEYRTGTIIEDENFEQIWSKKNKRKKEKLRKMKKKIKEEREKGKTRRNRGRKRNKGRKINNRKKCFLFVRPRQEGIVIMVCSLNRERER